MNELMSQIIWHPLTLLPEELKLPEGLQPPDDTTLFSLVTSAQRMLHTKDNPTAPLKFVPLSVEKIKQVAEKINAKMIHPICDEETNDLCFSKIKSVYCYKYALKNFYKKNPSLDTKKFQDLCAQFKVLSKEALIECMFNRVALKNAKMMTETYLEFNLKEEWQSEKWWYSKSITLFLTHPTIKKISSEKREEFQKVQQALEDHLSTLWRSFPNLEKDKGIDSAFEEVAKRANNKALKIFREANQVFVGSQELSHTKVGLIVFMLASEETIKDIIANYPDDIGNLPNEIEFKKEVYNYFRFV